MSDLRKLIDEESDELLLRVLRSAEDDTPGSEGRDRTFAALGLGAAPIAGALAGKGIFLGMSAWKWVVSLLVVTTVGSAGIVVASSIDPAPPPPPVEQVASTPPAKKGALPNGLGTSVAMAAPAPSASASAVAEIASAPSSSAATEETAPPARAAHPSTTASGASSAKPSASARLGAELAALDEARTALASGNAPAALARLDRYTREFPAAVLGPEATMLRIEALHAAGDENAARSSAKRFLATHPSATYENRIRTLLGSQFDAP